MRKTINIPGRRWCAIAWVIFALGGAILGCGSAQSPSQSPAAAPATPPGKSPQSPALETMEVAQAVMVTVDLDLGPNTPSIAEALRQVERRYVPDDGKGRTFAILDAYGEATPGKKLHMSMHVSSEKPGLGSLVFKPTGEVLWNARIVPGSKPAGLPKNLGIFIDDGAGRTLVVDGSSNPDSILDAMIRFLGKRVRDVWPDGAEREVTFIYSACGCPVKVMVRREGERTIRTKELPVIFPDDPAAVGVITKLMKW
jgi:hypothetical protein